MKGATEALEESCIAFPDRFGAVVEAAGAIVGGVWCEPPTKGDQAINLGTSL